MLDYLVIRCSRVFSMKGYSFQRVFLQKEEPWRIKIGSELQTLFEEKPRFCFFPTESELLSRF